MVMVADLLQEWGRSFPNIPADNIKLDNPFVGKEPFKVTYSRYEPPIISYLLNYEYSRIWNREHDQYLKRRQKKPKTANFIKPDMNARKHHQKAKEETKPLVKSKKYENVQSKIKNGK